jgi:hypothetical protein
MVLGNLNAEPVLVKDAIGAECVMARGIMF